MTEETLFAAALEKPTPAERAALLDRACAGDAALRRRVEALLASHDQAEFLGTPAIEQAAAAGERPAASRIGAMDAPGAADRPTATASPPAVAAGEVVGRYKLVEPIGEGGMGEVWLAQQTEPVKRLVALKVIKAGMDTKAVLARFEAERQALALMDHPNIAKVLDGGATPSGRPYFVMELVKGVPITKYCDQHHLTPRQRLELFVPVCHAIQHAHQKGIIHRDLKPSNVLVALYDGRPVPKIIDFGVAKSAGQALTDKTLYTGFGNVVGTLEYMSPEQAGTNQLDIDTRSDIYSLGVLLYELLTGSTPLTQKRMKETAYAEILRMIKEDEPPKPSTRLSDSGEALASISAQRHMEPAKLTKLVKGELDWIVMKTLEKDRNRRYETANGFAMDVQRYLANEAVLACPPTMGYRLRKFARRNKRPVLAATVVVLALVGGIIGTARGLIRARIAEADASREAVEKTEALTEAKTNLEDAMAAVDQLLTRLADERLADVPQMEPIRRELLQDALKFYQKFLARKSDDPVIRREAAGCYWRLGRIYFWLGRDSDANEAFLKAIAMMEELGAASSRDPEQRSELIWTRIDYSYFSKADECVRQRRRAVELAESMVADFPDSPDSRAQRLSVRINLASALIGSQPEEAERILQETLQLVHDHELLGQTHSNLGFLYSSKQRWPEAEQHFRHALKLREKGFSETPEAPWPRRALGFALQQLAEVLAANQQLAEAEKYERRAIPVFAKLASDYPTGPHYRHDLAKAQMGHAGLLKQLGQTAEAEKAYRQAADLYEKLAADFPAIPWFRQSAFDQRIDLSRFLVQAGRPLEAQEMLGKATTACEKVPGDFPGRLIHKRGLVRSHLELARLLKAGGKIREAQTSFDQAVAIQLALEKDFADKPEFRRELAGAHLAAADLLREDGRAVEAERFYRLAEAHWQQLVAETPDDAGNLLNLGQDLRALALLLAKGERQQDREAVLKRAIDVFAKLAKLQPATASHRDLLARSQFDLGVRQYQSGQTDAAERNLRQAIELWTKLAADAPTEPAYLVHAVNAVLYPLPTLLQETGRAADAERFLARAIPEWAKLARNDREDHRNVLADVSGFWAQLLFDLGKRQQAEEIVAKAVEQWPKNAHALIARGRIRLALGQPDKALEDFEQAIGLAPNDGMATWWWGDRSHAHAALKQEDKALADLTVATERWPDHWDARMWRGHFYRDRNRWHEAIADYAKAVDLNPQRWEGWHLRAEVYTRVQEWDKAIADETKAIELSAGIWNLWHTRGIAYAGRKEWAKAIADYSKALELNPKYQPGWQACGTAQYRAGDWEGAIASLTKSTELPGGGDADDWFYLGMSQWKRDQKGKARQSHDRAVQWMEKHGAQREELRPLRAEAAELLGLGEKKD
jgi:serine/threonine protein kinase/Tfp pilus assembly protein PilF